MKATTFLFFLLTSIFYFPTSNAQELWPIETLRTEIIGAWIRTADFDNDGDPDILIQAGDSIYWHENLQPGWEPHLIDPTFYNSTYAWVDVLDIDGDGDMDVLKAPASDTTLNPLTWNENLSDGSSWEKHIILDTPNSFGWMQGSYGDLDGDDDLDIIVPEYFYPNLGSLYWLENIDNTGEYSKHPLKSGDHFYSTLADIDDDGDLDIVSALNDVFWLENQLPDTTWTHHVVADTGSSYHIVGICNDLNGDGTMEVISNPLYGGNDRIIYYSNPGWQEINIVPVPGILLGVTGDIDNDGDIDVTYGGGGFTGSPLALGWTENQNNGLNWALHDITSATTSQKFCSGLADIDGDGDLDMVSLDFDTNTGMGSVFWAANPLITTSISEQIHQAIQLSVSPNPATDFVNIQLPETIAQPIRMSVFDIQGRLMSQQIVSHGQPINVGEFPTGMYTLKAMVDEKFFTGKFVKQ